MGSYLRKSTFCFICDALLYCGWLSVRIIYTDPLPSDAGWCCGELSGKLNFPIRSDFISWYTGDLSHLHHYFLWMNYNILFWIFNSFFISNSLSNIKSTNSFNYTSYFVSWCLCLPYLLSGTCPFLLIIIIIPQDCLFFFYFGNQSQDLTLARDESFLSSLILILWYILFPLICMLIL